MTAKTTTDLTPDPTALTVHASYDKKNELWDAAIREGKTEHFLLPEQFTSDDKAKARGQKWIEAYAKADEADRRVKLGWDKPKAKGKAKAEPKAKAAKKTPAEKKAPVAKKEKAAAKPKAPKKVAADANEPPKRGPSGLDVAAQMLKDAGTPMKCKELVDQMIAKGLWSTNGKTPSATIYAAIIREISEKGTASRFTKTERGSFAYNTSAEAA